jgi:plasmid stabilization system protein ParE
MSLTVRFLPEARTEYDEAVDWYEAQRPGLGARFIAAVRTVLQSISSIPTLHQVVHADVRQAVVRRFPYVVLYREDGGELVIVAVFHTSRDPAIWQARV